LIVDCCKILRLIRNVNRKRTARKRQQAGRQAGRQAGLDGCFMKSSRWSDVFRDLAAGLARYVTNGDFYPKTTLLRKESFAWV